MHYLDPVREEFKGFHDLPKDHPIHMINLLRFRDQAAYGPNDPETLNGEASVSGAEAYKRYGSEAAPFFARVGGRQIWVGRPEFMVIGPQDKAWDLAFIAEYPTAQAFLDMLRDPGYQHATRHRRAAVLDSRLIRTKPIRTGKGFGEEA